MARIARRTFFQQSLGAGLALAAAPAWARSLNERLNLGFIGLGGRGQDLLGQFTRLNDVRVASLCDPDEALLARAAERHPDASRHADLRELLNDKSVDAVVIATCNHWHALAAILACQAGKDVYVEKPLAHNHWEGQQVVRAARRFDRIVQIGTQQRSDPLQDELKEFLHSEQALGPIRYVQVCRIGKRAPIGKRSTPLPVPKHVDYNLWLGPALDEPIFRNKLHYDWHWNWNTGNGEMGNWGVHVLDDAVNVVLRDQVPFPKRILAAGGRVAWDDAGDTPNVGFVRYDTGTTPLLFALSNLADNSKRGLNFNGVGSGYVIHCEGGYYAGGRGGGAAHDTSGATIRRFKGDAGVGHPRNFVDAVFARDRSRLNAEVQIGHQSTAWCNLADAAIRAGQSYDHEQAAAFGQPLEPWAEMVDIMERHLTEQQVDAARQLQLSPEFEFDTATEQFVGEHAASANRYLRREYRKPFDVPAIA
jgi:Oxidoreductase family, NAD-binding Rossmann fold/Oxidoreductase family, C-terminal alpha/beta domain